MTSDRPTTPTPWEVEVGAMGVRIFGDGNQLVAECETFTAPQEDLPNAELIVRAVNNHAALVEALVKLRNEASAVLDYVREAGGFTNAKCLATRIVEADAALRAATETE